MGVIIDFIPAKVLMDNFWRLNEKGRENLLDYSDDLVQSGKYIKQNTRGGGHTLRLREIRKQKRLTQAQLAEKIGVDRATVTKWETGKAFPRANKLLQISTEQGCSLDDIMGPEGHYEDRKEEA